MAGGVMIVQRLRLAARTGDTSQVKKSDISTGKGRYLPALVVAAGLALAVPTTGFAIDQIAAPQQAALGDMPFTPANLDPELARSLTVGAGNEAFRFTPASRPRKERTLTMAVRVDDATARAISVRDVMDKTPGQETMGTRTALDSLRYNLGISRGYQSFAQPAPKAVALPRGIRDIAMPDLSEFRPSTGVAQEKPSRFRADIALDNAGEPGRAPRTLEGSGEQSVDVQGSYRVTGNLNVTAGVRLSQERDRMAPLTDGVEDSQAVYVGTRFKF